MTNEAAAEHLKWFRKRMCLMACDGKHGDFVECRTCEGYEAYSLAIENLEGGTK